MIEWTKEAFKMKKPFTLLCGTIALLCLFSMFVPIVAPHYSTELYHPAPDSDFTKDYYLIGDYYQARQYWSITKFTLTNNGIFQRVLLSVTMALLLYWCAMAFMGDNSFREGLVASVVNLGMTGYSVAKMVSMAGSVRWGVTVVVLMNCVLAVVCAAFSFSERGSRYTNPYHVNVGKKE